MALPHGLPLHRRRTSPQAAGNHRRRRSTRTIPAPSTKLSKPAPRAPTFVCFIAMQSLPADFLRDKSDDGQLLLCLMERKLKSLFSCARTSVGGSSRLRQTVGLGKFHACLNQPMANLHYILAPSGIVQKKDLPPRWGLLSFGEGGISVVARPQWQECARIEYVESAIARTLTGDIYRADDRAINSVNREIFAQQQDLATRIRSLP